MALEYEILGREFDRLIEADPIKAYIIFMNREEELILSIDRDKVEDYAQTFRDKVGGMASRRFISMFEEIAAQIEEETLLK